MSRSRHSGNHYPSLDLPSDSFCTSLCRRSRSRRCTRPHHPSPSPPSRRTPMLRSCHRCNYIRIVGCSRVWKSARVWRRCARGGERFAGRTDGADLARVLGGVWGDGGHWRGRGRAGTRVVRRRRVRLTVGCVFGLDVRAERCGACICPGGCVQMVQTWRRFGIAVTGGFACATKVIVRPMIWACAASAPAEEVTGGLGCATAAGGGCG
ncbi:hypothetical protein BJ912DRAFT_87805 [Pholiota molesta]|nr:hypothetical protein BJ912DRAFT_87805 [Pholiota molesta]